MGRFRVFLMLLSFIFLGCGSPEISFQNPPIIFISIDTLRSDHLPIYGYDQIETPYIDALASDGVVFDAAFSQYPLTLPSHVSFFSGKIPPNHGVRDNLMYSVSKDLSWLPSDLSQQGYRTAGFVSAMVLSKRTGFGRGFDVYESEMFSPSGEALGERPGSETLSLALSWLDGQNKDQPFMLFLHLYEPHAPYFPPEPFGRRAPTPYGGEIAYTDSLVGVLLERLKRMGLYDQALIVLFSDHGEGLGEHGEREHGVLLYREALQVPLVVKLPDAYLAGTRVKEPTALVDVKPTIEAILGLPHQNSDGLHLFDNAGKASRLIYSETFYPKHGFGHTEMKSVVSNNHHFISGSDSQLFDWVKDPKERNNLLPAESAPKAFIHFLDAIGDGIDDRSQVSQDDLALLATLGYTAQTGSSRRTDRSLDDLLEDLSELGQARRLVDEGEDQQAILILRRILDRNPCMHEARLPLAELMKNESLDRLEKLYDEGLQCDPSYLPLLMLLAHNLIEQGKINEVGRVAEAIWQVGNREAKDELAFCFYQFGYTELASNLRQKVRDIWPQGPYLQYTEGILSMQADQPEDAVKLLSSAAEIFDKHQKRNMSAQAFWHLGQIFIKQNQTQKAIKAFNQSLAAAPILLRSRVSLAQLYGRLDKKIEAIKVMDQWVSDFPSSKHYQKAAETMNQLGYTEVATFYASQAEQYR